MSASMVTVMVSVLVERVTVASDVWSGWPKPLKCTFRVTVQATS